MNSILIIEKSGIIKEKIIQNVSEDDLYKKAGLKTKTVNIHEQQQSQPLQTIARPNMTPTYMEEDSMVSISSLKDMQGTMMPKKSNRRKPRSDKNVISLDI